MPERSIVRGGETYAIRLIQPDDLDLIQKVQSLLEETFGPEEVDPLEILQAAIGGTKPFGSEENVYYRLYAARNIHGNIRSVVAGGLVALIDNEKRRTGDAILMNAYAATEAASKRQSLFRELYLSLLIQAALDATAQGLVLYASVGECTWTSEQAWNAVGQGRVYMETAPNILEELPYIQPPVDWDPLTGLPESGAGDVPEHLMLEMFAESISKDQLISIIDAIYRWNNKPQEEYFCSREAYLVHKAHVDRLQSSLNEFISVGESLHLLSAIDRSLRGSVGVVINEHTAADKTN